MRKKPSWVGLTKRILHLSQRTAPFKKRGWHALRPRDEEPPDAAPARPGPVPGRGRRRTHRTTFREIARICFWTLVVYGLWMLWNHAVWGWW